MDIHPSAVIHAGADLGSGVKVGPYAIIGAHVSIGAGTMVGAHVVIEGHTRIGTRNRIYPFVTLGTAPQDVGYHGEETRLTVGDENVIREYVTIHRATTKEEWETVVGNRNYLMAYSHVAHDCRLGDDIIMANAATLGGHVRVGNHAGLGGLAAVHQFVRIGDYAFVGGLSAVVKDVPPYMIAAGPRAKLFGVNQKGLVRLGFSRETIDALKQAYRVIWREHRVLSEGAKRVRQSVPSLPEVEHLLQFLEGGTRGILR